MIDVLQDLMLSETSPLSLPVQRGQSMEPPFQLRFCHKRMCRPVHRLLGDQHRSFTQHYWRGRVGIGSTKEKCGTKPLLRSGERGRRRCWQGTLKSPETTCSETAQQATASKSPLTRWNPFLQVIEHRKVTSMIRLEGWPARSQESQFEIVVSERCQT